MFDRLSRSARNVVFRARDIAQSGGRGLIGPDHILLALMECRPELFEGLSNNPIDLPTLQREVAQMTAATDVSRGAVKLRFNEQSKRVMQVAAQEARSCWERWEAPRRKRGQMLAEDQKYWEAHFRQPIATVKFPQWIMRWMLRRTWEIDERHLFLGLLTGAEYPGVAVLRRRGVTLEGARQRLCATSG